MVNKWSILAQAIGSACPLCRTPGDDICPRCRSVLPRNTRPCPRCAIPLPDSAPPDTLCADCQRRTPAFERVYAPLLYRAPVDDLIAGFKYRHGLAQGRMLAAILATALAGRGDPPDLLLPIPIQTSRLRERGFNQAAEIAWQLARRLRLPWSGDALRRVRDAGPQRGLSREQRRRNLHGAFACRAGLPSHVALIDDVITTGATVEEASRVLLRTGVERVEIWAVARTPRGRQSGGSG